MGSEKLCKEGNEAVAKMCQDLLEQYGPTPEYEIAITSAATTLLFHAYRLARHRGKPGEVLQSLLDDVAHNARHHDEVIINFKVEVR